MTCACCILSFYISATLALHSLVIVSTFLLHYLARRFFYRYSSSFLAFTRFSMFFSASSRAYYSSTIVLSLTALLFLISYTFRMINSFFSYSVRPLSCSSVKPLISLSFKKVLFCYIFYAILMRSLLNPSFTSSMWCWWASLRAYTCFFLYISTLLIFSANYYLSLLISVRNLS